MNVPFVLAVAAFALELLTGFLLSRRGKPYNIVLSASHKLIAVAMLVYYIIIVVQANRLAAISSLELAASVITILFFVTLVVTGAILSAAKTTPRATQIIHRILPYLAILATAFSLYLFMIRS